MNRERDKAFNNWEAQATRETGEEIAWQSGYDAALAASGAPTSKTVAHLRGYTDAEAEIERKLLAMAGAAFIEGRDDHAHWFRSLVNTLFKKPGETSA